MPSPPRTDSSLLNAMKLEDNKLLDLINGSGFLFQLGIEAEVKRTRHEHLWNVAAREYPWERDGAGGFIDLVLSRGPLRVVLECKRTREATWVFLTTSDSKRSFFWCPWAQYVSGSRFQGGWIDFQVLPACPIAEFCIVRGQGEGDKPLLERLCAGLVQAVDGLAEEELQIWSNASQRNLGVYIPVIVTTATLQLCVYDPARVSMTDGSIQEAEFKAVPYVRFRKSLATTLSKEARPDSLEGALADRERSVFIVNAEHFTEFLKELEIREDSWIGFTQKLST